MNCPARDWDWSGYSFVCDGCGTIGTVDDGFSEPGDDCPRNDPYGDDDADYCDGTMRLRGEFYHHSDETGMERWHDGESTERRCHDGVGLITEHDIDFTLWIHAFPDAHFIPQED